ncbi:hypothetical protein B2G74_33010, partial [Burkholderia sp. A27]
MFIQQLDIDVDPIERAHLLRDLVRQRQQVRLEGADHLAIGAFQLLCVDELPLLLRERKDLDLALHTLGHRALGGKVVSAVADPTRRDTTKMPDVLDADLVDR